MGERGGENVGEGDGGGEGDIQKRGEEGTERKNSVNAVSLYQRAYCYYIKLSDYLGALSCEKSLALKIIYHKPIC